MTKRRLRKRIICTTEQQSLRKYYRHKMKFGVGFSFCRIYCIKGKEPSGKSVK